MTPQALSATAGILLSLIFSYTPGISTWYAVQSREAKQAIMLGLLLIISLGAFGLACAGMLYQMFGIQITCDQAGGMELATAFFSALIANQAVFLASPQTKGVKAAKAKVTK